MPLFDDLIKKFPALALEKEAFDSLENRLRTAGEENAGLIKENRALRDRIAMLETQQDRSLTPFAEASGVLWKRKKDGGYEITPYCPTCKSALADYSGSLVCIKCNWQAPIKSFEAPRIHHELFDKQ